MGSVAGGLGWASGFTDTGWDWLPGAGLPKVFTAGAVGFRGVTGFATDEPPFALVGDETPPGLFATAAESTCGFGVVTVGVVEPWPD